MKLSIGISLFLLLFVIFLSIVHPVLAMDTTLIKLANDPAIYEVTINKTIEVGVDPNSNFQKHLFVNSPTFWSYFTGSWSELKKDGRPIIIHELSQVDFDSFKTGKNITVKSGSRLIKFNNSSKIYQVFGDAKLKLITDQESLELYGLNWRDQLVSIQNSFESDYVRSDQDFVDTDGDGLADEDEENIYYTDLNDIDSDSDGYSDGIEVVNGYNPMKTAENVINSRTTPGSVWVDLVNHFKAANLDDDSVELSKTVYLNLQYFCDGTDSEKLSCFWRNIPDISNDYRDYGNFFLTKSGAIIKNDDKQAIVNYHYDFQIDNFPSKSIITFYIIKVYGKWRMASNTAKQVPMDLIALGVPHDDYDQDYDGYMDNYENCEYIGGYKIDGCVKTDLNNKDTDGDGWWDGIEIFVFGSSPTDPNSYRRIRACDVSNGIGEEMSNDGTSWSECIIVGYL